MGSCVHPADPNKLVLWSPTYICTVDIGRKGVGPREAYLTNDGMIEWFSRPKRRRDEDGLSSSVSVDSSKLLLATDGDEEENEEDSVEVNDGIAVLFEGGVVDSSKVGGSTKHVSDDDDNYGRSAFSMTHKYGPLMYFGFVKGESGTMEAVAVERPLLKVLEALPEGFFKKRYGS